MKAVQLEHHLILLQKPTACSLCSADAHWQLKDNAYCSRCYLHDVTSMGSSDEFRAFTQTVHNLQVEEATDKQLDHLLAIVVLTERWITQGLKNAATRSPTRRPGSQ